MAPVAEKTNSVPGRQEKRRRETRAKLIGATIKLLYENGTVGLTMEDVAHEAGLTRGAIQYHFDSPKSLLMAGIIEIAGRLGQHLDVRELTRLSLPDRIDRVVEDYWIGFGGENYAAFIEIAVRGRQDPELAAAITSTLEELERERAIVWQQVFADTGYSADDIIFWRSTLLITLRGLALTKMIGRESEKVAPQIDLFKDMFKRYLMKK